MEDDNDYDYEAARAAELQAICDEQFNAYASQHDIYSQTFARFPTEECNRISTEARRARNYTSATLSYGELEFESFGYLICNLTKQGIDLQSMYNFVDLGSGVGKTVICAALLGIFEKCTGIEIVAELHKSSTQLLKGFYKHLQNKAEVVNIEFILGDLAFIDWSKTDMVFVHCTCFEDVTMDRILNTASKMKPGSVIICMSRRLPKDDLFMLVVSGDVETSWGTATYYAYTRNEVPAPGAEDDPMRKLLQILNRDIPF